ncbi:unnamed protein product [Urochloa humidicola]
MAGAQGCVNPLPLKATYRRFRSSPPLPIPLGRSSLAHPLGDRAPSMALTSRGNRLAHPCLTSHAGRRCRGGRAGAGAKQQRRRAGGRAEKLSSPEVLRLTPWLLLGMDGKSESEERAGFAPHELCHGHCVAGSTIATTPRELHRSRCLR